MLKYIYLEIEYLLNKYLLADWMTEAGLWKNSFPESASLCALRWFFWNAFFKQFMYCQSLSYVIIFIFVYLCCNIDAQ